MRTMYNPRETDMRATAYVAFDLDRYRAGKRCWKARSVGFKTRGVRQQFTREFDDLRSVLMAFPNIKFEKESFRRWQQEVYDTCEFRLVDAADLE